MKKIIFALIFCVGVITSHSQECGTDIAYRELIKTDLTYKHQRETIDSIKKAQNYSSTQYSAEASAVKIIPVVFHVMHNYGSENISDAQIHDAVQRLNNDYRKMRADTSFIASAFKAIHADCEIEFKLAQIDPNGNCTNGITRTQTTLTYNAYNDVKQLINWEHTKYLNIWVVQKINISSPSGGYVAGYAYYPGQGNNMDGIVLLSSHCGGIGTSTPSKSTTLAHEVGHYLGLPHTWGSSNSCGNSGNCSSDDGINDTPNTIGNCSTCDTTRTFCGVLENVQNFMDYGTCKMMFTTGQKNAMDQELNISFTGRQNLWSATNLLATGVNGTSPLCAPKADFYSSHKMVCAGTPITFYDNTWNGAATSWNWSFPGAVVANSSNQNPSVTYNTPGLYTVSLSVYNATGSDSIGKSGIILVNSSTATHTLSTYSEGFEGAAIPNADWHVIDDSGFYPWTSTNLTSYSGNKCIYINNYFNNVDFTSDELISSKSFDLTAITNPVASFMLAYAQRTSEDDMLEVYASNDCGNTWQLRYSKAGVLLATTSPVATVFTPVPWEWRKEYVSLATFSTSNNVMLKFKFTGNFGNNIYIDDINLSSYFVGIDEGVHNKNTVTVYPNPISNTSVVKINLQKASRVTLSVIDITGREVLTMANENLSVGEYSYPIESNLFSKGIYIVRLISNNEQINHRIAID